MALQQIWLTHRCDARLLICLPACVQRCLRQSTSGHLQQLACPPLHAQLPAACACNRRSKDRLNIIDWGVANATLEEVFIKLAKSSAAYSQVKD